MSFGNSWMELSLVGSCDQPERNGPQAVADYERMIEATKASRTAPSEDVGPRIPGNYYKTEKE